MYAKELMICEEFKTVEPWTSFEKRWFEMYKKSIEEIENEKLRKKNAVVSYEKGRQGIPRSVERRQGIESEITEEEG